MVDRTMNGIFPILATPFDESGQVDFESAFKGLRDIDYDGWLTIEAFSTIIPEFANATHKFVAAVVLPVPPFSPPIKNIIMIRS